MRTHVTAQTLNQVSILLITAGLKPSLGIEILKRDNLTLAQIKDLALKNENLQTEKQIKQINSLMPLTTQMKKKKMSMKSDFKTTSEEAATEAIITTIEETEVVQIISTPMPKRRPVNLPV